MATSSTRVLPAAYACNTRVSHVDPPAYFLQGPNACSTWGPCMWTSRHMIVEDPKHESNIGSNNKCLLPFSLELRPSDLIFFPLIDIYRKTNFFRKGIGCREWGRFRYEFGSWFSWTFSWNVGPGFQKMQPSMVLACSHVYVCIGIVQKHRKICCFRGLHAPRSRTSTTFIGKGLVVESGDGFLINVWKDFWLNVMKW